MCEAYVIPFLFGYNNTVTTVNMVTDTKYRHCNLNIVHMSGTDYMAYFLSKVKSCLSVSLYSDLH